MTEMKIGKTSDGLIWIGITHDRMERIKACLTGEELTAINLTEDDAKWLIAALRKELYGFPKEAENWMGENDRKESKQ